MLLVGRLGGRAGVGGRGCLGESGDRGEGSFERSGYQVEGGRQRGCEAQEEQLQYSLERFRRCSELWT